MEYIRNVLLASLDPAAGQVAVLARPTAPTVLAITGCLIAGVPVVPVPADFGAAERRHILTDSGAQGLARR